MKRIFGGLLLTLAGLGLASGGVIRGINRIDSGFQNRYNDTSEQGLTEIAGRKLLNLQEEDLYLIAAGLGLVGGGIVICGTQGYSKPRREEKDYNYKKGRERVEDYRNKHNMRIGF